MYKRMLTTDDTCFCLLFLIRWKLIVCRERCECNIKTRISLSCSNYYDKAWCDGERVCC